jgi:hypothetical protein
MAEEYDGIGGKGLGETTMIDVGALVEAFWRISKLQTIFLNCQYQDSLSISIQVKEIVV